MPDVHFATALTTWRVTAAKKIYKDPDKDLEPRQPRYEVVEVERVEDNISTTGTDDFDWSNRNAMFAQGWSYVNRWGEGGSAPRRRNGHFSQLWPDRAASLDSMREFELSFTNGGLRMG